MERLQRSPQHLQLLGAEFLPAQVGRRGQCEVQVGCAARAHLRGQVYGQGANDGVAGLHLGRLEVQHMVVERGAALLHPVQGAGVAADKPGGHERVEARQVRAVWGV